MAAVWEHPVVVWGLWKLFNAFWDASLWIRELISNCSEKVRVRDSNLGPRTLLYYNKDAVPYYSIIRSEGSLVYYNKVPYHTIIRSRVLIIV